MPRTLAWLGLGKGNSCSSGCAFGVQACRDGFRTAYFTAPKLFRALQQAHADGSLTKLLKPSNPDIPASLHASCGSG